MKLKKRKPVGRTGERSTLVIYIDCDNEDFDWLRRKIMPVVEEELDEMLSSMIWLEGDVVLSWERASGPAGSGDPRGLVHGEQALPTSPSPAKSASSA